MAQPKEMQIQVNDDVSMALLVAGEGEPVIYLHGAGGLFWDPYLDQLSNQFKVYAPFMPGVGDSTGLESILDIWGLVLTYYDLFDALELDSVNIVGHSMGGMIGCELAATDPSRVKRLLPIAPAGLFDIDNPMGDIFAMVPEELAERIILDQESEVAKAMFALPDDMDEKVAMVITQISTLNAAAKFLWPLPDKGLKHRLRRIKAPTLVIWGKQDGLIPVEYAQEFKAKIADMTLEIVDQASHTVQLEQLGRCLELSAAFLTADNLRPAH